MKRLSSMFMFIVLLVATPVLACHGNGCSDRSDSFQTLSGAANNQTQQQYSVVSKYHNGMISAYEQAAEGNGYSWSKRGSEASEGQVQAQQMEQTYHSRGTSQHYVGYTVTHGGSEVKGAGTALHSESANIKTGMFGYKGHNEAVAGSVNAVCTESSAAAVGRRAKSEAGTEAGFVADYTNKAGNIQQSGWSEGQFKISVKSSIPCTNTSNAYVKGVQAGYTAAANNGKATLMAGSGEAYGTLEAGATAATRGKASATGEQAQFHQYNQTVTKPNRFQSQSGFVYTRNKVSASVK